MIHSEKFLKYTLDYGTFEAKVLGQCKTAEPAPAILCTAVKPCPTEKRTKKMSPYYDEDLNMYLETAPTDTQRSQQYFLKRLSSIGYEKDYDLRKQFGFVGDERPKTFEEFMTRVSSGKFTWSKKEGEKSPTGWTTSVGRIRPWLKTRMVWTPLVRSSTRKPRRLVTSSCPSRPTRLPRPCRLSRLGPRSN